MLLTTEHRIRNAVRFKLSNDSKIWLVIGGQTAWPTEPEPPTPAVGSTGVNTPIGGRVGVIKWVVPDPLGALPFVTPTGVQYWREVTDVNSMHSEGCRWCLLQSSIAGLELPVTTFRELGFFTGLVPNAGFEAAIKLSPSEISSYGFLETIEYRPPVTRDENSSFTFSNILEF